MCTRAGEHEAAHAGVKHAGGGGEVGAARGWGLRSWAMPGDRAQLQSGSLHPCAPVSQLFKAICTHRKGASSSRSTRPSSLPATALCTACCAALRPCSPGSSRSAAQAWPVHSAGRCLLRGGTMHPPARQRPPEAWGCGVAQGGRGHSSTTAAHLPAPGLAPGTRPGWPGTRAPGWRRASSP